jgi:hypothetical protein
MPVSFDEDLRKFVWEDSKPTTLYRIYDKNDNLLYVGISCTLMQRLRDHSRRSWWFDAAKIVPEIFPSKFFAEMEEEKAIRNEKPFYNKVHNISPKKDPKIDHRRKVNEIRRYNEKCKKAFELERKAREILEKDGYVKAGFAAERFYKHYRKKFDVKGRMCGRGGEAYEFYFGLYHDIAHSVKEEKERKMHNWCLTHPTNYKEHRLAKERSFNFFGHRMKLFTTEDVERKSLL